MRAAVTHWRDGCLVNGFMVTNSKVTKNLDGSESHTLIFPKTLSIHAGDKVKLTYYTSEKDS